MLGNLVRSFYIAKKDLKEYYLKPGTMSWGVVFPIAFTLAFLIRRGGIAAWLAPGLISMAIFFSSTSMSAVSIVFERKVGSFERLLLFPVSYTCIALGKSLSSFLFGILSSLTTVIIAYMIVPVMPSNLLLFILCIILATFHSSTFGVLLAFLVKDPSQTMTIFNIIRFPMIFLSGIIIPLNSLPLPAKIASIFLPLTYSTEAIRYSYLGTYDFIPPVLSLCITLLSGLAFLLITSVLIEKSIP